MGRCKKCGGNNIIKTVKLELIETYYSDDPIPFKSKKSVVTKYKCKDCGATKIKK